MTKRQHSAVVREMAAWCRAKGAYPNAAFPVGGCVLGDIADLLDELLDLRAKEIGMKTEDYQRDALRMLKLAALAPKDEEMDRYAALAVFYMRKAIKALLPERREEPTG